jgi:hydrogenase expression/formation protein HypE
MAAPSDKVPASFGSACPLPHSAADLIRMAHGGGGAMMHRLLESLFLPAFSNPCLDERRDGAVLDAGGSRLAFSTDSYVVQPRFFPGGDIGSLSVHGTLNDLAMCGARPRWLAAGFILEEGLPLAELERIVDSMRRAADADGVSLVTGDTKVVDRGKGDGVYVNTSGIGIVESGLSIGPASVRPGDAVLLSGDLGRHGIAILAARHGIEFESPIESDVASLVAPALDLLGAGIEVHCLRDLTRGGLASALVEIAAHGRVHVALDEASIPVGEEVRGVCELLGLDPLHVACEGRFVAFLPARDAPRALESLRRHPVCAAACVAGEVSTDRPGIVSLRGRLGPTRLVEMLSGEQLPRIC